MSYWDEEMNRVIAHLAQHNWASSDGDVHEIVEYVLTQVKDLQKKLDSLREFCHKEDYDIYDWEVKNIEVIE